MILLAYLITTSAFMYYCVKHAEVQPADMTKIHPAVKVKNIGSYIQAKEAAKLVSWTYYPNGQLLASINGEQFTEEQYAGLMGRPEYLLKPYYYKGENKDTTAI